VKKTTTSSDAKIDPHKGAGISVLLVEDNDNIAKVVCLFLESIGFTVTRVNEGEAAIAEACNQLPDVILMDIQMPVMDGIEATKRIRAIPELQETPIIALTGLAMPNDEDRCIEAGASLFMSKPYRIKDLADNIISLNSNASRLDSIA
jgi:CheY-like chemotaxis protein